MKTSVTLESPDRVLEGIVIRQQTGTGFLCLTDLQTAYDKVRGDKGWNKKEIGKVLFQYTNKERIYYLLKKQGVMDRRILRSIETDTQQQLISEPSLDEKQWFMQRAEHDFINFLKELNVYKTIGTRGQATTWCNPYIWVLVAMELSPEFYANVVMWITDRLILSRVEAGDMYKELTAQIQKFPEPAYAEIAIAINERIFGQHFPGIRQTATKADLSRLTKIEEKLAYAIESGFIQTEQELLRHISEVRI